VALTVPDVTSPFAKCRVYPYVRPEDIAAPGKNAVVGEVKFVLESAPTAGEEIREQVASEEHWYTPGGFSLGGRAMVIEEIVVAGPGLCSTSIMEAVPWAVAFVAVPASISMATTVIERDDAELRLVCEDRAEDGVDAELVELYEELAEDGGLFGCLERRRTPEMAATAKIAIMIATMANLPTPLLTAIFATARIFWLCY
jgi:hypothetical protein